MTDHAAGRPHDGGVYDWWSRHPRLLDAFYSFVFVGRGRRIRRRAVDALNLDAGERVLELGAGPGAGLEALRDRVGATGTVVGVDASEGMTRRAAERVRDAGWENVHVVAGDATRLPAVDGAFDAAYAAMSLSAMADPAAAVAAARDALRPGGRLVVLDARPFQHWPLRLLNLVLVPLFRATTNWVPEVDLTAELDRQFDDVTVSNYTDGTLFIATARRSA